MKIFPSSNHKRRLVLFPLMDVFFILLMVFLFVEQFQPMAAFVEVPKKSGLGQVNAVIQILDEGRYAWIDNNCLESLANDGGSLTNERKTEFLYDLAKDMASFRTRLLSLDSTLKAQELASYALLLRCPNHLDYEVVSEMVKTVDEVELDQSQYQLHLSVLGGEPSSLSISKGFTDARPYVLLEFQQGVD
jgi:biopolymer transport protein ExbD